MKIIVKITDGKHSYSEDVYEYQKESFDECSTNGANPWLKSFENYTRDIKEHEIETDWLNKFNSKDDNAHFIFGWCECFLQSNDAQEWMYESEDCIKISVTNQ